ncbi:MAG: dynamin family protein [Akkermansia sp.]
MNIQESIKQAIEIAETYSPILAEKLRKEEESFNQEGLQVTVLGEFKAGKSTLINRLFLRQNLLPIDILEATAVPTHIRSGCECCQTWMRTLNEDEEILVNEQTSFSADDLKKIITSSDEEERADMAKKYSKVVITMPGILPNKITIVDTPGLNTTNTGIYVGTLQEAYKSDAVIYMVRAKQLSLRDIDVLKSLNGNIKNTLPLHIIISHDGDQEQQQLENIKAEIQAKLHSENMHVRCSFFDLSNQGEGNISHVLDSLIDNHEVPTGGDSPQSNKQRNDLASNLMAFFDGDVRYGRFVRIARNIKPLLEQLLMTLTNRLQLSDKSENELTQLGQQLCQSKQEYAHVVKSLLIDIRGAQLEYIQAISLLHENHLTDCYEKLDKCNGIHQVKETLTNLQETLPCNFKHETERETLLLEANMRDIIHKYQMDFKASLPLNAAQTEINLDGGFLSQVPTSILVVCDYIIFEVLSPLPFGFDLALRFLLGNVSAVQKIMPANLVGKILIKYVKKNMTASMTTGKDEMIATLNREFAKMQKCLGDELTNNVVFDDLEKSIDICKSSSLSDQEKNELTQFSTTINQILAQL